jgi:hypothetical protein
VTRKFVVSLAVFVRRFNYLIQEEVLFLQTPKSSILNSLCGNGQSLFAFEDAMVRNIKEYNDKFKGPQTKSENGHRAFASITLYSGR